MTMDKVELGREIRSRREAAGISLSQLAERISYSKGYLSRVETGRLTAHEDLLNAYDSALGAGGELAALLPAEARQVAPGNAVSAVVGLPPTTPVFVGRERELARVTAFLAADGDTTACVLTGMAGVGKTALALRAAWRAIDEFPDGCVFLDLAAHTPGVPGFTARDALEPLLRLLKRPGERVPSSFAARANLYQSRLRGRRMLLVLDNVASTAQVAPLLPAETQCRVILTSRNRLSALDDAMRLSIDVLPEREAVTLFRSVGGDRARSAPDRLVEGVAERCGLLPLAIRVAAARFHDSPALTLDDLHAQLNDETARLQVLDDGERSVAATFNLSCGALADDQMRLFGLLALHPGRNVEVDGAAALTGTGRGEARRLLDRLAAANLVAQSASDRFAVHDLLREFARDRVLPGLAADDRRTALIRLLDHSVLLAIASDMFLEPHRYREDPAIPDRLDAAARFTDREDALTWLTAEWPALVRLCHVAAENGLPGHCKHLAYALRSFFFLTKLWDAWIDTHRVAADAARAVQDVQGLAVTLSNLGVAYSDRGDLTVAVGHFEEARELFREVGDDHGVVNAMSNLAWATLYLGEYKDALAGMTEVLASYREIRNVRNTAIALRGIALVETELGRYADAARHADEARMAFEKLDLRLDVAMSANGAAWARYRGGEHAAALAAYREAATLGERCGSRYETVRALTGMGNVHAAADRRIAAERCWARADRLYDALDPVMLGEARIRSSA